MKRYAKKFMVTALALTMALGLAACGSKTEQPAGEQPAGEEPAQTEEAVGEALGVTMITDTGGVNDQSFNQSAYEGLKALEEELGSEKVKISFQESKQDSDYIPNLETALDGGNALIWGIGFKFGDILKAAAEENPDQKYGIIDYSYGDETPENVVGILFKDQENSFLVGYVAGRMTQTGKVGFVGGVTSQAIANFEYGFKAGVATAAKELGKEIEVNAQYAEAFGDPAKGKAIATTMYQQGADVVFHAAGGTGDGVIEAAKEANKWVIGVDRDQSYLAPEHMLVSTIKGVGQAIRLVSKDLIENDKFDGGTTVVYGLADSAVDIAFAENGLVTDEVKEATEMLKQKVVDGSITVPVDEAGYKAFVEAMK